MIRTAGHAFGDWLRFEPGQCSCGPITDGVALEHANCENPRNHYQTQGGWVLAFEDLERMYLAAKQARTAPETSSAHQYEPDQEWMNASLGAHKETGPAP
jgi:hypothetical protein